MIWNWYRRRKRAVALGDSGYGPNYWCDPETGDVWQARTRWSLFTVHTDDPAEETIGMLDTVHSCTLYVEPDWRPD